MNRRSPLVYPSRRALLQGLAGGAALAGLGGVSRGALAAPSAERKFLFVMCTGGWDTTYALTPMFDAPDVHMPEDAEPAEAHGIPYVAGPTRPAVDAFFESYGDRACVIHGIEVRSVTHERCRQLVLTGRGDAAADDWPSILGASSKDSLLLPHLVLAGPAYTDRYTGNVVRVGDAAQLPKLLDERALRQSTLPVSPPSAEVESLTDAFVRQRAALLEARAEAGQAGRFGRRYAEVLDQAAELQALAGELDLEVLEASCERDILTDFRIAFDVFSAGLSRCAMVRYNGWCNEGWDTHQGLYLQDTNHQDLFEYLGGMMEELQGRTALDGSPLEDSVTVLVFSEMGRHPRLNAWAGKDHWTFTSCMLLGAGVRGGRVVGEVDGDFRGRPVDLASGEASESGVALLPEHLGATLLALGDVDPGEHLGDVEPIGAVLA